MYGDFLCKTFSYYKRAAGEEKHAEAGLLAGLVTPWGPHGGAVCS